MSDVAPSVPSDPLVAEAGGTALGYSGPAHAAVPGWQVLPGVHAVVPVTEAEVRETERYDTPDLRLCPAGIVLEIERVIHDRAADAPDTEAWVLRLPDSRPGEQLTVPVPAEGVEGVDPGQVPAQMEVLVRRLRGDEELGPVGRVRTVRSVSRLRSDDARELATVHHDEVQVATLGAETAIENWTEVTVYPAAAGAPLLQEIDAALRSVGLNRAPEPGGQVRLAELLAERAPAEPPRHTGEPGSAGALLLGYLGAKVDALAAAEADLRADRPDAVHQMRVNARRLRSALRSYRSLLDGPRVPHLIAELRWLGQALAGERDAEVQQERLEAAIAGLDDDLVLGPVQAQVTRHFARLRAESRAAVTEVVDGRRYADLQAGLRRLLADPPLSGRAGRSAAKVLPGVVAKTAAKLERRMDAALADLAEGEQAPESLHRARKTGKQLRYAAEVVRPAGGRLGTDARGFAKELKAVQRVLGDHQDAVVARETLRTLGARAGAEQSNGFTYGVLHGHDTAEMAALEQRLPQVWEQTWSTKACRRMRG
ncbi:CYTH and CHAD domain-containing protein [Pseudonocardia phyllosphaerae]|uniref:CYTH and CHAD domain-containing protein n=1 Tax=Pseudonocardia phyllosphaerae TaxID=3390502 RepID=UPI00397C4398